MLRTPLLRTLLRPFCTQPPTPTPTNPFHNLHTPQPPSSLSNKPKLDALAFLILSLPNAQLQYLLQLQNQQLLQSGASITNSRVINTSQNRLGITQYLYQQKWIQEQWKDYHVLTSVFSDQLDVAAANENAEVVKQIYQFELTSVDPASKIKVIKVIRELLNLGLKEAKDIVDKAPIVMKKGKKEEGEALKTELAKNGCVVTLK